MLPWGAAQTRGGDNRRGRVRRGHRADLTSFRELPVGADPTRRGEVFDLNGVRYGLGFRYSHSTVLGLSLKPDVAIGEYFHA